MRGIVLAGGRGKRLWPITKSVNKQLLQVHDKPMIHYPIASLMTAGIREILVICNPNQLSNFQDLLGDGSNLGITFEFIQQDNPGGIAEAFLIAEEFINNESVALILGDNIFHGSGLGRALENFKNPDGATIFAYHVSNPSEYGIIEFNQDGTINSVVEKPKNSKSKWAIPGLYFFDNSVVERAKSCERSARGELEIISVLESYLNDQKLMVSILPRGTAWLDTGTIANLNDANNYFRLLEERQGTKVSCLEEVAWRLNYINDNQLRRIIDSFADTPYGEYLESLLDEDHSKNW